MHAIPIAQVDLVSESIRNLESLLQDALAIARDAILQSSEALEDVRLVDDIIQQIQVCIYHAVTG